MLMFILLLSSSFLLGSEPKQTEYTFSSEEDLKVKHYFVNEMNNKKEFFYTKLVVKSHEKELIGTRYCSQEGLDFAGIKTTTDLQARRSGYHTLDQNNDVLIIPMNEIFKFEKDFHAKALIGTVIQTGLFPLTWTLTTLFSREHYKISDLIVYKEIITTDYNEYSLRKDIDLELVSSITCR